MLLHPCSDTGRLQSEISDLERKVSQCAQSYEVHQTNSNVDSLEHTVRELSSTLDGIRYELEELRKEVRIIKESN